MRLAYCVILHSSTKSSCTWHKILHGCTIWSMVCQIGLNWVIRGMLSHIGGKLVWFGLSIRNASDKHTREMERKGEREEGREGDGGWWRRRRWSLPWQPLLRQPSECCWGLCASARGSLEREGGEKEKDGGEGGGEVAAGWRKCSVAVRWPFGGSQDCISTI